MTLRVYNIIDLANFACTNTSTDTEIQCQYLPVYLKILQNAFRKNGDMGVVDAFKDMWGQEIYCVGRGRFVF